MDDDLGLISSVSNDLGATPEGTLSPKKSKYQEMVPEPIKNAIGGNEAALRMLWNVPVGTAVGGLGGIYGGLKEGSMEGAAKYQEKAQHAVSIDPFTKQGAVADEMLGEGYDYVKRDVVADALVAIDKHEWDALKIPKEKQAELEAKNRSLYEGGFDAAMFGGMIKSGLNKMQALRMERDRIQKEGAAKEAQQAQVKQEQVRQEQFAKGKLEQSELGLTEEGSLAPPTPQIGAKDAMIAGMSPAEQQTGFRGSNRGGGLLSEEVRSGLERELNPPTEQRIAGQGELFTGERAYPLDEHLIREGGRGARERPEPAIMEAPELRWMREQEPSQRYPNDPVVDVPVQDALRQYEAPRIRGQEQGPIEPTPALNEAWRSVPRSQRGAIGDMDPRAKAKVDSVIDTLLVRFGGHERVKWNEQHYKNARDWAEIEAKRAKSAEMKGLYLAAHDQLSNHPLLKGDNKMQGPKGQRGSSTYGIFTGKAFDGLVKVLGRVPKNLHDALDILEKKMDRMRQSRNYTGIDRIERTWTNVKQEIRKQEQPVQLPPGQRGSVGNLRSRRSVQDEIRDLEDQIRDARNREEKDVVKFLQSELADLKNELSQTDHLVDRKIGLPPKGQRGHLGAFEKATDKKGLVGTLLDYKKQFNVEKRPLKVIVAEEKITKDNLKDLASDNIDLKSRLNKLMESALSNFAIDKTMSVLAAQKGPVGHIIKWAVDNRRNVTREKDMRVREREQEILRPYIELGKKSRPELTEMKEVWIDNIGKAELTRESFKTDRQWETYSKIQEVLKQGWEETNKWRKERGMKPIPFISNYFPAVRKGDYWVRVVDSTGALKWAGSTERSWGPGGAEALHRMLKKEFEKDGLTVEKPYRREKSQYELSDLSAFEETIRALEKDDPVTRAIQERYSKLAGSRGFGRTGLHRKGIPGALGFEKGETGVRNAEKVLEEYVRRQEAYIANLKIAKLREEYANLSEFSDGPGILSQKIPMADKWINEYFNHSLGMDLSKGEMLKGITEALTNAAGISRNVPRRFIQDLSGTASLLWLMNTKFVLSQTTQPTLIIPKILQMRNIDPSVANPVKAFWEGQRRWFTRAEDAKGITDWASKHGYLDSAIAALATLKATDVQGQRWGMVGSVARYPLAKLEKEMVRGPVLLMFDSALKDAIKDPKERWQISAEMMDYYMTHYDRESSPLMYNKMGLVGEAARPLKQYSHNNFGQFFEYLADAKNKKELAPLGSYVGLQALIGGLKGTILVAEATAIIYVLNNYFGQDIMTPEEGMIKYFGDFLTYGGLSTMLGVDVSSSVASPSMPSMFSLPGLEFGAEAAASVGKYLMKVVKGQDTDADKMRAMMAVTPNAMHGWIQELYTQPGGPVPNPKAGMQGNYRRDGDVYGVPEREISRYTALKSINESKANAGVRVAKQLLMKDAEQKLDALNAIADRVINKQPMDKELIMRYVREGGDPQDLPANIQNRVKQRLLTWKERQMSGTEMTPQRAHKLQLLKQILDEKQDVLLQPEESNIQKQSGRHLNDAIPIPDATKQSILAAARKAFPNDQKKQQEWAVEQIKRIRDQQNETRAFHKNMRARESGEFNPEIRM